MTNIEEIARLGSGETPIVPNQGLFGYVLTERRYEPTLIETFVTNSPPNVVDRGDQVIASMDVPSIALAAEVFDEEPNYTQKLVNRLRQAGMNPYDLVMLFPDLVNEEYDPDGDEDADDAWWNSVGRSMGHESLLMWLFMLPDGSMPEIVRTNTVSEARFIATSNNIVVVDGENRKSWTYIISPMFITRLLQRYAAALDWMGSTQGVIYHAGMGDLVMGDTATWGDDVEYRMATNISPTNNIVIPDATYPSSGPRDLFARVRYNDHQIPVNKRKGCAVYNTLPFRLYSQFINRFGLDDGMTRFELIAMYTLTQASLGGFAQPETWPTNVDFNIAQNGDGYVKDLPGVFFRDVDSADPRQMTPGDLLGYIAMNVTMAVARDAGAKPFLAQAEIDGPDTAHASARATMRTNYIQAHSPDEVFPGTSWFGHLPMRELNAGNTGAITQNMYPTTVRMNVQYRPGNIDTFNRLSHERRPMADDTPLETLDIINAERSAPITIEEGEDRVLTPAVQSRRYKLNIQSTRTLNTMNGLGDTKFAVVNLPITASGTVLNKRALAASPLRDLATHATGVYYVGNHSFRPPKAYNSVTSMGTGAIRADSFLKESLTPVNIDYVTMKTKIDGLGVKTSPSFDYDKKKEIRSEAGAANRIAGIALDAARSSNGQLNKKQQAQVKALTEKFSASSGPALRVSKVPSVMINVPIDEEDEEYDE